MTKLALKKITDSSHQIGLLEDKIAALEKELQQAERSLNTFESQIREQLNDQIVRIRELTVLYKKQQENKKAWRLEQKKKGKNYREPVGLKMINYKKPGADELHPEDQQELKRLYKEAMVQVHPDKFGRENEQLNEKANSLTVQLIDIYKSGDLNGLKDFHEHIISGNALSHEPYQPETIVDHGAMLIYLRKKRQELMQMLQEIRDTEFYQVLTTYPNPFTFVDELRILFDQRIVQLEKRMKSKWQ